jgi:hypothetical protein
MMLRAAALNKAAAEKRALYKYMTFSTSLNCCKWSASAARAPQKQLITV